MYFTPRRLKLYLWAMLVLELLICFGFRSSIRSGAIDFRGYYTAGHMLRSRQGALLYDYPTEQRLQNSLVAPAQFTLLFFAPPFVALLFAPFSFAPYVWALLLFGVVNVVSLAATVRVMRPYLRALAARWRATPALLFLTFLPVGLTVVMGQLSIVLLLLCCVAYALLESGSAVAAGLVFSLALMKLQIAIPAVVLFVLWRRWRFVLGFLMGAGALAVVSAAVVGLRNVPSYVHSLTRTSAMAGTALQSMVGIGPRRMSNLYGLFFTLTATNRIAVTLTVAASVLLLGWAATRRPSLPLALLVAILVSYHLYPCDLTVLLLPISLLCNRLFEESEPAALRTDSSWLQGNRRAILLCAIGIFLVSPALIEIIVNDLIFLLTLPILALAMCPCDWSTFRLSREFAARTAPRTTAV